MSARTPTPERNARVGEPAPEFELPDASGRLHRSADYLGAPLVVLLTRHVH